MVVEQTGDDAIVQHYEQLGGSGSFLGTPVGSAYDIAGGRAQDYTGGTIYFRAGTGAHEVHGAIRGRYLELGGPAGFLGFPLTDETGITGGRRNDFQHGSILWHAASGRIEVIYTSVPSALLGVDLERIPTTQKVVALTFDAGANDAALRSILATLAANGVPGTFFLTGDWVNQFPSAPALIYNAGHRIGNHSMTHPDFTTLTDAQIAAQISSAQRTIEAAGGDPRPFFRFPFGARDSRTIADVNAAGYAAVRWTVDTLGWQGTMNGTRGPSFIVQRVMASAQPGQIVLMHLGSNPDDGSTLDAAALPQVISQLREAGYGFVTLDAALG